MTDMFDIKMPESALNPAKLSRLKWATMIAVIGIPVTGQILGAMMMFADQYPLITSTPVILGYCLLAVLVVMSGIYVVINRMHLRLFGLNRKLDEWEGYIQTRAQAFSYKVIFWGVFAAFIFISGLGFFGAMNPELFNGTTIWTSLSLNISGISALVIGLFYLIFFLPTLYTAWTIRPLTDD